MSCVRRFAGIASLLLCGLVNAPAQTQAPQMPTTTSMPGMAPTVKTTPPDALSTLQGRVIVAETGRALHRARVRLSGTGNANAGLRRETLTNQDGRYRFDNLPPGRYMIHSSRAGFVGMQAGQKHPNDRTQFWNVSPGQVQQLDFALPRGSVVAGRLTDDAGEPLAGAQVTTLRVLYSSSGARLQPWYSPFGGWTDDRGAFRLAGLTPGTYVVAAQIQSDVSGESYATTYYPGTRNLSEAQRFHIGLSDEVTANFSMMMTRQVRVTGEVQSSRGEPLQGFRALLRTETSLGTKGAQVREGTGKFEFAGIAPGSYTLDVSTTGDYMPDLRKPTEFASVPIEVGDEDISGLLITTGHGTTVGGRVSYDGTAARIATPRQRARVIASLLEGPSGLWPPSRDQNNGVIADDGTFTITGTYGKMLFRTTMPGWELRSVTLDGVDITDVPYDASRGGTNRLEIIVTDQRQALTGTVVDALGKPPSEFVVLAFPGNLKAGSVPGRYLGTSATYGSDGTFRLTNLPPGDYFAAALASVPENAHYDLEFHEALKARATPFQLSPGETAKLELSLIE